MLETLSEYMLTIKFVDDHIKKVNLLKNNIIRRFKIIVLSM